jgi:hypothetical protein
VSEPRARIFISNASATGFSNLRGLRGSRTDPAKNVAVVSPAKRTSRARRRPEVTSFRSDLAHGKVIKLVAHTFRGQEYDIALVKLSPSFERGRYALDSCNGRLPPSVGGLYAMEVSQIEGLVGNLYNSATNRPYIVDPTLVIDVPSYKAKRHSAT